LSNLIEPDSRPWYRTRWGALLGGGLVLIGIIWLGAASSSADPSGSPSTLAAEPSSTTAPTTVVSVLQTTTTSPTTTTSSTVPSPTTEPDSATTTTTATVTTRAVGPAPDDGLLIELLATIAIAPESPTDYDRSLFEHWIDADGDGCDTREEVLIRDAKGSAQVDAFGCAVIAGDWYSPYDGVWQTDPSNLDIDHVVPLKEAWDSGAKNWAPDRRRAFANDLDEPRALIAVTSGMNQSKSAADPSNWMPPNHDDWCRYLGAWVRVKAKWGLTMDQSEYGRIEKLLDGDCEGLSADAGLVVAPAQTSTNPPTKAPTKATTTTTATTTTSTAAVSGNCDPSYPTVCIPPGPPDLNCGDVSFRKFKVLAPDPHGFDKDKDGVGCES
jgi:Protein of unknown function (DUF1524)